MRIRVGDEQDEIADLRADLRDQRLLLGVAEMLRHRRSHALRGDAHRHESLRAAALGELGHRVDSLSRNVRLALDRDRLHRAAGVERLAEGHELRAAEDCGNIAQLQAEAQVRAVAAVPLDRVVVFQAEPGLFPERFSAEALERAGVRILAELHHVLAFDERHLDVELRRFVDAIGPRVLVAEDPRDLEVLVEARHHQDLLQLLW